MITHREPPKFHGQRDNLLTVNDLGNISAYASDEIVPASAMPQAGLDQVAVALDLVDDAVRICHHETGVGELRQSNVDKRCAEVVGTVLVGEAVLTSSERVAAVAVDELLHLPLGALAVRQRIEDTARSQDAPKLCRPELDVGHVVQHVHRHRRVEHSVGKRERLDVATHAVSTLVDEFQAVVRDVEGDQLTGPCERVDDVGARSAAGVEHMPAAEGCQMLVEESTEIELELAQLVDRRPARRGHACHLVLLPIVDARHARILASPQPLEHLDRGLAGTASIRCRPVDRLGYASLGGGDHPTLAAHCSDPARIRSHAGSLIA